MILRDFQEDCLNKVRAQYAGGVRRVLMCSPTGSGKSTMTAHMIGATKMRTLILVHRVELLDMVAAGLPVRAGIIQPGRKTPDEYVCVGMMQTVSRRLDDLPAFDWIISDEAHLAMCPTWMRILQHFGSAFHLGMSATPCRLDSKGLGTWFQSIVYGPTIRELTTRGYLAPCRVYAPSGVDLDDVRHTAGDFNMADATRAVDRTGITGSAVAHYRKLADGRRALAFCCTREHAEHVAADFAGAGIPAAAVDGSMSADIRAQRIGDFRAGRIRVLANVDLLTTGYDDPGVSAGIMLRPTESVALYLQIVGRILRAATGKQDAILLDHVNNVGRLGLPDQPRQWSLDGSSKRDRGGALPVTQCPECFAAHAPAPKCIACGHVYTTAGRAKPKQVAGELVAVPQGFDRLRDAPIHQLVREARSLDALHDIARARGYQPGWAFVMWKQKRERFARRAGG